MHKFIINSTVDMSVTQLFSEITPRSSIVEWARNNPTLPRVVGIDVGQSNLTLWFGAPSPGPKATTSSGIKFVYFGWVLIQCNATKTNKAACKLVTEGLANFTERVFALASDIVIEKQHKKNGRMRAIATAIKQWIRKDVPSGKRMRIVERQAMHKFANVVQLPCPMPREYSVRKSASFSVGEAQTRAWAGERWFLFLHAHRDSGDDLTDAALIAQDYMVAYYLITLIQTHKLRAVSNTLMARRNRNTWRKTKKRNRELLPRIERDDDDDDIGVEKILYDPRKRYREESESMSNEPIVSFLDLLDYQQK